MNAPSSTPASQLQGTRISRAGRILEHIRRRLRTGEGELKLGEERFFLLLAVIIGLLSGLAVVLFRISIEYTRLLLLGSGLRISPTRALLAPSLAGLVVALLVRRLFPRSTGSGVNQTKAAVYIYDGYVPFTTVIGKFVTCALAIGSGQSLGPEDPSLQMGAGIASALGRRMRFSRDKVRLIAPVGAAAGLAAAFNAPISAVLFVIEEVIGTWYGRGAWGDRACRRLQRCGDALVSRRRSPFRHPRLPSGQSCGVACLRRSGSHRGNFLIDFREACRLCASAAQGSPGLDTLLSACLSGACHRRDRNLAPASHGGRLSVHRPGHARPISLAHAATARGVQDHRHHISFVSGTPGGMFAPTLFIGAMIGGAVGDVGRHFFPWLSGSVGAYALVGMGTLFAGFLRVPMTSVFMVLEVSGNYSIILPVMISNTIAYVISRRFQRTPLFDLFSRQDDVDLPSMEERREEQTPLVEDAMRPAPEPILSTVDSVKDALSRLDGASGEFFLVGDGRGKWYGITKDMLGAAVLAWDSDVAVGGVLRGPPLPHVHPDHALDVALRRMGNAPFLPVVHRADFTKLEGTVSLKDILEAYRQTHSPPSGNPI